jgi:hypothetical protein
LLDKLVLPLLLLLKLFLLLLQPLFQLLLLKFLLIASAPARGRISQSGTGICLLRPNRSGKSSKG